MKVNQICEYTNNPVSKGNKGLIFMMFKRVLMGVPSYQLTTNFSAICQLTTNFS